MPLYYKVLISTLLIVAVMHDTQLTEGVFDIKFNPVIGSVNPRPMGHHANLNVQLWRLYSAKIL